MIIRCVVAATNSNGSPAFHACRISCRHEQYELGEHYDRARFHAEGEGYEGEMVIFDEHEGPDWLFERFAWESSTVVDCSPLGE